MKIIYNTRVKYCRLLDKSNLKQISGHLSTACADLSFPYDYFSHHKLRLLSIDNLRCFLVFFFPLFSLIC